MATRKNTLSFYRKKMNGFMVLMSRVTTQVNAMNKVLINKSRGELLGIIDSICVFRLFDPKKNRVFSL